MKHFKSSVQQVYHYKREIFESRPHDLRKSVRLLPAGLVKVHVPASFLAIDRIIFFVILCLSEVNWSRQQQKVLKKYVL